MDPGSPYRFNLREFSGSFGDLGTFLPLAVGMSYACGMDLGVILIFAGLMNVASGLGFRQPIAVQPMKAIAAVAIAEGLVAGEIAASGIAMGIAMVALGLSGAIDWIGGRTPKAIVRGIQLGVGLKLVLKGADWILGLQGEGLPLFGYDSLLVAAIAALLLVLPWIDRVPVLAVLFLAGFGLVYLADASAYDNVRLDLPDIHAIWPSTREWLDGLLHGAIPQLPLTVLNSVIAVCALSADYFPGRGLGPRRVAISVGLMNLVCVPFGGMPMCHGAGGLAAQYRFGARTGGSVIMLGIVKLAVGLLFGVALLAVLGAYPRSILAVMLILAGWGLASVARDSLRGASLIVVLATAVPMILINTVAGFGIGLGVWVALRVAKAQGITAGSK